MKRIAKIAVVLSIMTITLAGCEASFDIAGPVNPDVQIPGGGEDGTDPGKRPVPIKPKRNPGGKIERPKLIEDLIHQVITPNRLSYDDNHIDEPR